MGRHKIEKSEKNKIISVSILPQQKDWLEQHPKFDPSKYFQICLEQIINEYDELESLTDKKEEKI